VQDMHDATMVIDLAIEQRRYLLSQLVWTRARMLSYFYVNGFDIRHV
jgi:hypothetical protein